MAIDSVFSHKKKKKNVIFHSYVSLPEGIPNFTKSWYGWLNQIMLRDVIWFDVIPSSKLTVRPCQSSGLED